MRSLALHCAAAVAFGVDRDTVVCWMHDQGIWDATSPAERAFLESDSPAAGEMALAFQWRKEAEWTLLWAGGLIESLGPPSQQCDTVALAIDIMPRLGSDIGAFLARARFRPDAELAAENTRHRDLWRRALDARRAGTRSADPDWNVLFQRRYVFEWLTGPAEWDLVMCDE